MAAKTNCPPRKGRTSASCGPTTVIISCSSRIATVPITAPRIEPIPPTMSMPMYHTDNHSEN